MRFLVLLFLLLAATAFADSWLAYGTKTFVSPDGTRKLIVKENREFVFGDVKGTLPQLPLEAMVFNGNLGAVLFERYGEIGVGDTLARLKADGTLGWRLSLRDLFDRKVIDTFTRTMSSIWWNRAWWVDERRGKAVLVSRGGHVREVDLKSGKAAAGGPESIIASFPHPAALEAAIEMKLEGARGPAARFAADKSQPVLVRFLAATLSGKVPEPLVEAALGNKRPLKERRLVIRLLGTEHVEALERAAMRRETAYDAIRAIAGLGSARTLASVIAAGDTEQAARRFATDALGKLPADRVGKAIESEFADADAAVAGALLRAGITARVESLSALVVQQEETLIRALDHGHAPIEWTAEHFTKHPSTEAVDALLKTFGKHQRNPRHARKLIAALRACTGLDFGSSFQAWRKGLRR